MTENQDQLPNKIDLNEEEGCGPCGQGKYVDTTNYAECLPWEAPEKLLVLGGTITGAPFDWLDFIVPGSEVKAKHSGMVLDVKVDEEAYQMFIKSFGPNMMLFSRAGGQGRLTRAGWKEVMGTDALKGMIMKTLNRQITGGGVKVKR